MGVSQRLKSRFRRFLQRPGTTVDLAPLEKLLPAIEAREEELARARRRRADRGRRRGRPTTSRSARSAARPPAAASTSGRTTCSCSARWRCSSGKVAEMATGEGKTLTAAIAAYGHVRLRQRPGARAHRQRLPGPPRRRVDGAGLHAARPDRRLGHRGVHPARSGARRTPATSPTSRSARPASTTCATSWSPTSTTGCSRALATAIVDEADSILIDEARVPMVLAGAVAGEQDPVHAAAALVRGLRTGKRLRGRRRRPQRRLHHRRPGRRRGASSAASTCTTRSTSSSSPRSTSRCTPTPCCTATSTTSCATARSS